jgi:hypothetical protein
MLIRGGEQITFDIDDPEIRRKRAELYDGLISTAELMAIMRRSRRAISRLILRGMPHTQMLGENLFDLAAVKVWLFEQAKASLRPGPRGRGRPRIDPGPDDSCALCEEIKKAAGNAETGG